MRLVILAALISISIPFFSSCAFLGFRPSDAELALNAQNLANREKNRKQEEGEAQQKALIQEQQSAIRPGLSLTEIKSVWGLPSSTEFMNGTLIYHYKNADKPMLMFFKNERLVGWQSEQTEERRLAAESQRQEERERLESQLQKIRDEKAYEENRTRNDKPRKVLGALLKGFSPVMNNSSKGHVNCTTTSYGNIANTDCL